LRKREVAEGARDFPLIVCGLIKYRVRGPAKTAGLFVCKNSPSCGRYRSTRTKERNLREKSVAGGRENMKREFLEGLGIGGKAVAPAMAGEGMEQG